MPVAVITGGNAGIGYELAKGLMKSSPEMQVVITSRTEANGLDAKASLIKSTGKDNIDVFSPMDQSKAAQVESLREYLKTKYPDGIDILVNNAGISLDPEVPVAKQTEVVRINYFGLTRVTDALVPMIRQNGKIISMASQLGIPAYQRTKGKSREAFSPEASRADLDAVMNDYMETAAKKGSAGFAEKGYHSWAYCFSKLGVLKFSELLAQVDVIQSKNILAVSCCPGWCKSKLTNFNDPPKTAEEGSHVPLQLTLIPTSAYRQNNGHFFFEGEKFSWRGPACPLAEAFCG